MGWTAKTGSLEPGKWADIIAVERNPVDDVKVLQDVKFVMRLGGVHGPGIREYGNSGI